MPARFTSWHFQTAAGKWRQKGAIARGSALTFRRAASHPIAWPALLPLRGPTAGSQTGQQPPDHAANMEVEAKFTAFFTGYSACHQSPSGPRVLRACSVPEGAFPRTIFSSALFWVSTPIPRSSAAQGRNGR
jgi:hypothetical protein